MYLESLVGKLGVFIAYEDTVWGEEYGGKKAKILEGHFASNGYGELTVEFLEDGKKLTIGIDEFELV